jgi:hypothetical protein
VELDRESGMRYSLPEGGAANPPPHVRVPQGLRHQNPIEPDDGELLPRARREGHRVLWHHIEEADARRAVDHDIDQPAFRHELRIGPGRYCRRTGGRSS